MHHPDRPSRDAALVLEALSALAAVSAEAANREAVFAAADKAAQAAIGHRLFTVMAFDAEAMTVQRLYSSNPQAYPLGGRKKKRDTEWGRQVLERGKAYIGRSVDDIRASFDDHETILGLGLGAVLNMPVHICGRVVGTVNLLHVPGYYDTDDLDTARVLAGLIADASIFEAARL